MAPAPCYRGADAKAAAEVVKQLPAMLKLPTGAPVYADGASSGGSIALRLPRLAKLDGVIGGEELGPWSCDACVARCHASESLCAQDV